MGNIRPLGSNVVVEKSNERKSAGGIFLPDSSEEKSMLGKVIAVGPGKYESGNLVPTEIKSNDVVLFGKYAGSEISLNGNDYLVLKEEDIMGIIEG
jgi:chaperonin GroES